MRRKLFMAVATVAVVGLFFWSQTPRRAPVHEGATSDAPGVSSPSGARDAQRDALEQPPPLTLPSDDDARASRETMHAGYPAYLPKEALATLRLIERGGPYPYRQDDGVFQNRERRLPPQPRGYYREFTVKTPGSRDRGARRIIAGGQPPVEFFYTDDHYRSFRRFASRASAENSDANGDAP